MSGFICLERSTGRSNPMEKIQAAVDGLYRSVCFRRKERPATGGLQGHALA